MEAKVGGLPEVARVGAEIGEQLKLARSNLVGLSERMEGLERRLPVTLETIEGAAVALRETAVGLAATGEKLEAAARTYAAMSSKVTRIEAGVKTLGIYAFWRGDTGHGLQKHCLVQTAEGSLNSPKASPCPSRLPLQCTCCWSRKHPPGSMVMRAMNLLSRIPGAIALQQLLQLFQECLVRHNVFPDYAQSSSGPLSVEKSDPLGQKATAEPVRKRNQTPGGTPDLRGTAAVFLQHELRT